MHDLSEDRRLTPVVGASAMALVLAGIYWISRAGFSNPIAPIAFATGISLFHVTTPHWVARYFEKRGSQSVWTSEPMIALGCLVITMIGGWIALDTGLSIAIPITLIGVALALLSFVKWLLRGRATRSLLFLIGVAVFTIWCAGVVWGSRYKMPLFWETFAFKANLHHDPFYYASMANMLETYQIPSTGLDGLPVIKYHFGSPWLFAKWGHVIGIDVLSFYSLGYPIIVMPLFFYGLFLLARGVRRNDWRSWIAVLAATVGFIPTRALDAFAIWNSNAFISESYLIGMAVFFITLASGVAMWERNRMESKLDTGDAIYVVPFMPIMLALSGFLKVSLMVLLVAVVWYLALRLWLWTRPIVIASLILSGLLAVFTYRVVQLPDQNSGISPLHFMRFDAAQNWQQFFPLFHLLWTWVYVTLRMWEERITDLSQVRLALRERRIIDVEILLLIAILGFLPGEIISIHGGSAVYFSDVQRWVALAFIVSRMPRWQEEWSARRSNAEIHTGIRGVRLSRILAVFVLAPFVVTLFVNLAQWPVRVMRTNTALRASLAAQGGDAKSVYHPIVTELREISRLPESQRREIALFIPQSNQQYWSMFTSDGRCSFTPFIAPAVASVALIDGMPAANCKVTEQYNMPLYQKRLHPQVAADVTDDAVCGKARAKGFRQVIVLDAPPVRPRRIDCYLGVHG